LEKKYKGGLCSHGKVKEDKLNKGILISFEGISGVGKTYFRNDLEKYYVTNPNIVFQKEIMDENHQEIQRKIFDILSSTGSKFFDMGKPITETALLAAKAAHKEETIVRTTLEQGKSIVSDRYVDSICVYQALMLVKKYGGDSFQYANKIFNILRQFCTVPSTTFLFKDHFNKCIERAEKRDKDKYSSDEITLLRDVEKLYESFTELHKSRYKIVDLSGLTTQDAKELLINEINKTIERSNKIE